MAGRKIRDAEDARRCLDAAARERMSRTEWARMHGIDGRSLNAWRLNLERVDAAGESHLGDLRLVELVTRQPAQRVLKVRCGPFDVDIPPDFDEDMLGRVLAVVASC
jgi:hypothetical protein